MNRSPSIAYIAPFAVFMGFIALQSVYRLPDLADQVVRIAVVSLVLIFVGLKMIGEHYVNVPTEWTLGVVLGVLAASILASVALPMKRA